MHAVSLAKGLNDMVWVGLVEDESVQTMNNLKISKRLLINGRSRDGLLQGKQRKEHLKVSTRKLTAQKGKKKKPSPSGRG